MFFPPRLLRTPSSSPPKKISLLKLFSNTTIICLHDSLVHRNGPSWSLMAQHRLRLTEFLGRLYTPFGGGVKTPSTGASVARPNAPPSDLELSGWRPPKQTLFHAPFFLIFFSCSFLKTAFHFNDLTTGNPRGSPSSTHTGRQLLFKNFCTPSPLAATHATHCATTQRRLLPKPRITNWLKNARLYILPFQTCACSSKG